MPKELIPAGWLKAPCTFLLRPTGDRAELCGACEREFGGWWASNSRRHCRFCGYLFHRQGCTHKIQVEGEFFRQRICSRCHYYRSTAQLKLQEGEEFECVGCSHGSPLCISLSEETAEIIFSWKDKGLKETADLAQVEVRKGFSHVHHNAGGNYEPLRSFSIFIKDSSGERSAYHLQASSALICQLWVEGLKAASYVYHKMLEQEHAAQYYSDRNLTVPTGGWFSKPYLPTLPSPELQPGALEDEEWEDLSSHQIWGSPLVSSFPSASPGSPFGNSSGYQSDLSLSFCSSTAVPRQALTVHSFNFSRPSSARSSRKPSSLPPTPRLPPAVKPTLSLPPTPGVVNTQASYTSTCSCHYRVIPSQFHSASTQSQFHPDVTQCCENCKESCQLALDVQNF